MSICPIIDGALPMRQNGKTLPCATLVIENAKLRELVRDLYKDLAAILGDGLWMELYESRMMELGVDA